MILNIANAQEFNDYSNLEIESELYSKLTLDYKEENYKIDYVSANLTFFPRTGKFQEVEYKIINNPASKNDLNKDSILYRWENPKDEKLEYGLDAKIKSEINFNKIKTKVKFPLEDIPELKDYTSKSETITSNDINIRKKAVELAEGEDDLFIVVDKIAVWTKENINYSLETLTAEVSQDSSWVFQNKRGVCDELTALFIAMLRSLNIPAKVVAGQAYTNLINDFGNHAWAEVYFPGYGWVAFDPTYGQMGYVDSTHVKMRESIDIKEPSVSYLWRSFGVDINAEKLDVKSKVITKGSLYKENIKMKVSLFNNEFGPGSYFPLQVEIENLNDYYLPITLYLTKAPEEINDKVKHILLKPRETKKEFFILKIPDELKNGFIYTSKAEVTDLFNNSDSIELKFADDYKVYSLDEAVKKVDQFKNEEKKVYSSNVKIECDKDREFYYSYQEAKISCKIKNSGNSNLKDIDLCYLNKCEKIDLDINEEKPFDINLNLKNFSRELFINANNNEISKSLFFDLNILKDSDLKIKKLDYPENVEYDKDYKIKFSLFSESEIKNIIIKLGKDVVFDINNLKGSQDFDINFKGKNFYKKDLDLTIDYKDLNNKQYSLKQDMKINVVGIPFYIRYGIAIIIVLILFLIFISIKKKKLKAPNPPLRKRHQYDF